MPNWCMNTLTLRHKDPAMIKRAKQAVEGEGLLNEFIPVPADLKNTVSGFLGNTDEQKALDAQVERNKELYGYSTWYDFCVSEWGTKWDVRGDVLEDADGQLCCSFDSAWSPPCEAYAKLMELGFEVEAFYYEPGMGFVGKWDNGDDQFFEYSGETSDTVRDVIGEELDDYFGISEDMAMWEEENKEENENQ